MYSVCRIFSKDKKAVSFFVENSPSHYKFDFQKNGNGECAVCDISKDMVWEKHKRDLENFVQFILEKKKKQGNANLKFTIDLAIDNDDIKQQDNALFLHYESSLLKLLGENGIDYEISFYISE